MWWLGVLAAAATAAPPTYLTCQLPSAGVPFEVHVAVDEGNQRVTIGQDGKTPASMPALFTPEKITAVQMIGTETKTWSFGRVDLSVNTKTSFTPEAAVGTCKIVPTPTKRAF
jgi:hypothetical protein